MSEAVHAQQLTLSKPVFFIGFMGAGKTSVARHLAQACGLEHVDADEYLEHQEGRAIASIFAQDGEGRFRDLESRYLRELAQGAPCLVGCGGGVVKRPANVRTMKDAGYVVYLAVDAEAAAQRIPDTGSRPLFGNLDTARATIAERVPLYEAAADASVDTTARTVAEVADEVRTILVAKDILIPVPQAARTRKD